MPKRGGSTWTRATPLLVKDGATATVTSAACSSLAAARCTLAIGLSGSPRVLRRARCSFCAASGSDSIAAVASSPSA